MGNSSSHTHESLDKGGFTRGAYGDVKNTKASSFRFSKRSPKKMDRLRRSFRDSFRRRKDRVPESSKPHQWQADEQAVRAATCSFPVKYLGCVEVFESRGMQVCEEALKVLRNSRRRAIRGLLHVSGDGLRVVDDDTKGLIVDQTIEKVSFCAPDRNHERGFSYICRDGTTRRWMCHGFLANKDSGERLSHAVGCAFAVCLERKQRRDKECGVTMTFDMKNSTFTRSGSFRTQTLTERLANSNERGGDITPTPSATVQPQPKPHNPFAIERPHATPSMLERQGSFRAFNALGTQSPFKRQMSLRINDLPSNAERQKAFLDPLTNGTLILGDGNGDGLGIVGPGANIGGGLPLSQRTVSPIPELSPHQTDTVSQLCQELSQGLSLLTRTDTDDLNFNHIGLLHSPIKTTISPTTTIYDIDGLLTGIGGATTTESRAASSKSILSSPTPSATSPLARSPINKATTPTTNAINTVISVFPSPTKQHNSTNIPLSMALPLTNINNNNYNNNNNNNNNNNSDIILTNEIIPSASTSFTPTKSIVTPTSSPTAMMTTSLSKNSSPIKILQSPTIEQQQKYDLNNGNSGGNKWIGKTATSPTNRRAPSLNLHGRAKSLNTPNDPFDAEWVAGVVVKPTNGNTNPFISPPKPPAQSFQVQL